MTFRYARHTADLKRIEEFYTVIVGLEKLGGFQDHDNYDGIFLGFRDQSWHLEFTVSDENPVSKFDEDVYVKTEIERSYQETHYSQYYPDRNAQKSILAKVWITDCGS